MNVREKDRVYVHERDREKETGEIQSKKQI